MRRTLNRTIVGAAITASILSCTSQPEAVNAASNAVLASPVAQQNVSTPTQSKVADADRAQPASPMATAQPISVENTDARQPRQLFAGEPRALSLNGNFTQGGLLFGKTVPGAKVTLDEMDVMVGADGDFVVGFGRDSALTAMLRVTRPDGVIERQTIELTKREFPEERIDNLDQSKVSGFTQEQLDKIAVDRVLKNKARAQTHPQTDYVGGFDWPVTGRISGVFGSRRILNGQPSNPHSGVDVARPSGTPVRAPAAGLITLAQDGMYFEGGLILLDHGQWLESAYLHLSRIDVVAGQRVEKGDIIGAIGATGRVTGPHLHWSMRWMSRLVDPQLVAGEMPKDVP